MLCKAFEYGVIPDLCKAFSCGVTADPFFDLRTCKIEKMKGIADMKKNKCLVAIFSFILVGNIWRKPLIELTKLAKISYKLFSYGVIPDLFLDLRSSKMEEMERFDAMIKVNAW